MDQKKKKIDNDFTKDNNYFIASYVYGFHVIVTLGTVGISTHLLTIVFLFHEYKNKRMFL